MIYFRIVSSKIMIINLFQKDGNYKQPASVPLIALLCLVASGIRFSSQQAHKAQKEHVLINKDALKTPLNCNE
jgi:hypothetical protein